MSRCALVVALLVVLALLFPTLAEAQKPGEIVFSTSMINPASPAGLTNAFKAGDPIYAVAFVPSSFGKLAKDPDAKKLDIEVFLYNIQKPKYDYQEPQEMQLSFSTLKILRQCDPADVSSGGHCARSREDDCVWNCGVVL